MKIWPLLTLLSGCGPGLFQNSAPLLVEVNGVEVHRLRGIQTGDPRLMYTPGETFAIELEIKDQEGHNVSVWWPESPRGWQFPSDDIVGVWQVPPEDELIISNFIVVLEDDHRTNPLTASWFVPLWHENEGDTGL